jgi:hypothetical protein
MTSFQPLFQPEAQVAACPEVVGEVVGRRLEGLGESRVARTIRWRGRGKYFEDG